MQRIFKHTKFNHQQPIEMEQRQLPWPSIATREWECNQDHPTKIKLAKQG
jgi:hypothetical protein